MWMTFDPVVLIVAFLEKRPAAAPAPAPAPACAKVAPAPQPKVRAPVEEDDDDDLDLFGSDEEDDAEAERIKEQRCVVEDDKVGTDMLEEEITKFEDYVQSVDVAAFNKI
ncbi:hypothetical protein JZ751_013915 [Albula glossodonta]|uniref:Elongation factor 1-delta n=1 Tax=Albula glossodonta TaxID=121402 RepID=A0A8T2N5F0_9TELE|nr:hypothetical protein JZ751_013915 [Albula glossodonta]